MRRSPAPSAPKRQYSIDGIVLSDAPRRGTHDPTYQTLYRALIEEEVARQRG